MYLTRAIMTLRMVFGLLSLVAAFVCATAVSQHFKPIGCFKDSTRRSFPKLIANFRSEITNWSNFEEIIKSCSKLSRQKGYRYFGIQFYGECWSGEHAEFDGEGFSLRCVSGVGKAGSNFVYENIESQATEECGIKPPQSRIIGGTTALPNEWPWQAEILLFDPKKNKFVHRCGGTLINKWWIVTAAHCVFQNIDPKVYKIRLGEHDRSKKEPGEMELPVSVVQIHDRFLTKTGYGYDIALMKLAAPAIINPKVLPACLPKLYDQVKMERKCFVTGWGVTEYKGLHAKVLQQAKLPLVSHERCEAVNGKLREVDKLSMLCAGYGGKSSISGCHGDSGGPFVCQEKDGRWFLRGIVSWGDNECTAKFYSVFARVSSFIDWIDYHMMKEPLERPTGCTDAHFYCEEWKAKGYCNYSYFDHMLKGYYCKKTCGACEVQV